MAVASGVPSCGLQVTSLLDSEATGNPKAGS